jgi:hypothetical protein
MSKSGLSACFTPFATKRLPGVERLYTARELHSRLVKKSGFFKALKGWHGACVRRDALVGGVGVLDPRGRPTTRAIKDRHR